MSFGVFTGIVKVWLRPFMTCSKLIGRDSAQGPSPFSVLQVQLELDVCTSMFSMFCLVSVYAQAMYDLLCLVVFSSCTSYLCNDRHTYCAVVHT